MVTMASVSVNGVKDARMDEWQAGHARGRCSLRLYREGAPFACKGSMLAKRTTEAFILLLPVQRYHE